MSESTVVKINGKEYTLAPLRMKHLKQITKILAAPRTTSLTERFEIWYPFIEFSIKEGGASDFNKEELDELTMQELIDTWTKVQGISGINIVAKAGEKAPTVPAPIGPTSTVGSAVA